MEMDGCQTSPCVHIIAVYITTYVPSAQVLFCLGESFDTSWNEEKELRSQIVRDEVPG